MINKVLVNLYVDVLKNKVKIKPRAKGENYLVLWSGKEHFRYYALSQHPEAIPSPWSELMRALR